MYLDILINKLVERVNQPQVHVEVVRRCNKTGAVTHKKTIPIAYVKGHADMKEGIRIVIEERQIRVTDWEASC